MSVHHSKVWQFQNHLGNPCTARVTFGAKWVHNHVTTEYVLYVSTTNLIRMCIHSSIIQCYDTYYIQPWLLDYSIKVVATHRGVGSHFITLLWIKWLPKTFSSWILTTGSLWNVFYLLYILFNFLMYLNCFFLLIIFSLRWWYNCGLTNRWFRFR